MAIAIELLVILSLILLLLFWTIWFRLITWIARRKYKSENDKSRYGEEQRREVEGGEPKIPSTALGIPGPTQPESGELLQTTSVDPVGEVEQQHGKTSSSNGKGFFFRRRK